MTDKETAKSNPKITQQITDDLKKAIEDKSKEGRIGCAVLRRLAEDRGISYMVAGAAADSAGIKVKACDLGCF